MSLKPFRLPKLRDKHDALELGKLGKKADVKEKVEVKPVKKVKK